jgi:hypothetical protein
VFFLFASNVFGFCLCGVSKGVSPLAIGEFLARRQENSLIGYGILEIPSGWTAQSRHLIFNFATIGRKAVVSVYRNITLLRK